MNRRFFLQGIRQWGYTLLYIVVVALVFSACQRRTLEDAVAQANSHCPYDMGQSGKIVNVALDNDYVTFTYDWTASFESFERLRGGVKQAGGRISMLLSDPDGDTRELLNLIASEAKGVRYVFRHATASAPIVEEFSAKTLKTILDGKGGVAKVDTTPNGKENAHEATTSDLQALIRQANATYPQALGNGIRLDSIELEGNFLVYHSSLEETEVAIKTISDHAEGVKKSMLKALAQSGNFFSLCSQHKKGLIFRYHGLKSGKTFGIILSPEEMAQKK